MKKGIIFSIFLITLFACNGQIKKNKDSMTTNENDHTMKSKIFDIADFDENKNDSNERHFTLEDGTVVYQIMLKKYYEETSYTPKPNLYHIQKKYSKSGKLFELTQYYSRDFLVLKREYNESGIVISEIDYDEPYKFSFNELLDFLKNEYPSINLSHRTTMISRGKSDEINQVVWEVRWSEKPGRMEKLVINGTNGKLIDKSYRDYVDN